MFKYYLYKFGQFLVTHLPLKLAYSTASFVSDLHFYFSFRDRRAVMDNLKVIFPSGDNISRKAQEVFRNFGKYLVDFFRMTKKLDLQYIRNNVKLVNLKYLDQILKEGKGGISLTAHIGNWELGAVILSMLGYPLVAVALPHKERIVNDLFNNQRQSKGITVIQTNDAMRKCVDTIKNNKLLGVLADRDFTLSGEVVDFLGKKAFIPKGAAVFSRKTGCPILPVFLIREQDDTFTLSFGKPIYPGKEDKEGDLKLVRQYAAVIEKKIKEYPTQWLMFRRFWTE